MRIIGVFCLAALAVPALAEESGRPVPRPVPAAMASEEIPAAVEAEQVPAPRPFKVTTQSPLPAARRELLGPTWPRPHSRPAPAYGADGNRVRDPAPQCDPSGAHCIRFSHQVADTCMLIERLATVNNLPPEYFARLIWRESLFEPYAVSPAGALGIAQFMPSTARLRGLVDPFNPAAALVASAEYLAELRNRFGNLGMAAVAYNGGEARAASFLARRGGLPSETRAYVQAITGYPAESWRHTQPRAVDMRLDRDTPFQNACVAKATKRAVPQFPVQPAMQPWAVIVAAHQSRSIVASRYAQAARRNPVLARHDPLIAKVQLSSMRASQYTAQIGQPTRTEAMQLCSQIRRHGSVCTVLRNRGS